MPCDAAAGRRWAARHHAMPVWASGCGAPFEARGWNRSVRGVRTAEEASVSVDLLVVGRVQGVGFRFFAHEAARRSGAVGHVTNLPDGNLRVYAEAPRAALDALVRAIERGPSGSRVRKVVQLWGPARGGLSRFTIESTR